MPIDIPLSFIVWGVPNGKFDSCASGPESGGESSSFWGGKLNTQNIP